MCEFQPRHKTDKQPQGPTHGQVPTGPAAREETRVTVTSLRLGQVARRSRGGGVGQTAFDDAGMRGDGFADRSGDREGQRARVVCEKVARRGPGAPVRGAVGHAFRGSTSGEFPEKGGSRFVERAGDFREKNPDLAPVV